MRKKTVAKKRPKSVSVAWVLNQLAGMRFPNQGQAYDFVKASLR